MKKNLSIAIVLTVFFLSGLALAKPILEKIPVDTSEVYTKYNAYQQRDVSFSKNGYPFLEYFWNGAWIDYKMANFFLKNIGSDGNCELTISGTKNMQTFSVRANTSYVLRIKPWNSDYYSDSFVTSTNDKLVFKSAEVSQKASKYEIVLEELPKEGDVDLSNLPDKEWFHDTIWEQRQKYCAKTDTYINLRSDGLFGFNYGQPDKFRFDGDEKWEVKDGFLYLSWNGGFAIWKYRLTSKDTDYLFGTFTKRNEPYMFHRIKRLPDILEENQTPRPPVDNKKTSEISPSSQKSAGAIKKGETGRSKNTKKGTTVAKIGKDSTERKETIQAAQEKERGPQIWGVIIGINQYEKIQNLNYAVNDAQAFYQYLVNTIKIPADNVRLLLDHEANSVGLRSAFLTHLKNAAKQDLVIVFFAGQGTAARDVPNPDGDGLEKYLLPFDADPTNIPKSALPMRELSYIFKRIQSERLLFIADVCYLGTGPSRSIDTTGAPTNISDAFVDRIAGSKGRVIITAGRANEASIEKDDLKHGVFTHFLLKGLDGEADQDHDGLITLDEIYGYVAKEVPIATSNRQHPFKKGTFGGSLVLGKVR